MFSSKRNGKDRMEAMADQIERMFIGMPTNVFNILSNIMFDRIMKQLGDPEWYKPAYEEYVSDWKAIRRQETAEGKKKTTRRNYLEQQPLSLHAFHLKKFYQLQCVDRRFANYFERRVKDLPKVPIGVRIQLRIRTWKSRKTKKMKILYHIHNGHGIISSTVYDFLQQIDHVLRFGRVVDHFTVFGLPLDDNLISAIKKIDTSKVERAFFLNIPYVHFVGDSKQKANELVGLFPNAEPIDFHGPGYDYEAVFGSPEYNPELEREDVDLTAVDMARKCLQLTASSASRKGRLRAKRNEKHLHKMDDLRNG